MSCSTHPAYTAQRKPRGQCEPCWRMWIKELDRREAAAYNTALPEKLAAAERDRIIRLYGTPQDPKYPHRSEPCGTCGNWPMWDTPSAPTTHRRCLPCWDAMADW